METIVALIVEYVAIWAPAIVAVLGIVAAIIPALMKIRDALAEFRKSEDLKKVVQLLEKQGAENAELRRLYLLGLEEMTKIKDYADQNKE